jgi:hypothetical protein
LADQEAYQSRKEATAVALAAAFTCAWALSADWFELDEERRVDGCESW